MSHADRYPAAEPATAGWLRAQALVQPVAVAAVAIAALLAAVMHTRSDAERDFRPACAECGIVETVVPLAAEVLRSAAHRIRVRMDDGSWRMMEQRDALPAGSRVMPAPGQKRVLAHPAAQG
jgi:membrane protein implicated in regulation of membrane protease activity